MIELTMAYAGAGGGMFSEYEDPNAPMDGDYERAYRYEVDAVRGELMRSVARVAGVGSFQVRVRTAEVPGFDPATATIDDWCERFYAVAEVYRGGTWDFENATHGESELAAMNEMLTELEVMR